MCISTGILLIILVAFYCSFYCCKGQLCDRPGVAALGTVIGERERANLVERFIYVERVSAHARLLTRFFLSEIISKFLHIFTHARYAPIDLASPRTLLHSTACTATFGD